MSFFLTNTFKMFFLGLILALACSTNYLEATPGWSSPVSLSAELGVSTFSTVKVDSLGNAHAIWLSMNGSIYTLQGARQLLNQSWSSPVSISSSGDDIRSPLIGIDSSGNAFAVWIVNGTPSTIQAAVRPFGESWGTPSTISDMSLDAFEPKLEINGSFVIIYWIASDGTNYFIQSAVYTP